MERFHQTLRRELLEQRGRFASLEQAQKAVDAWVEGYNHQRPHQALAMAVQPPGSVPARASQASLAWWCPAMPTHRRRRAILGR